MRLRTLIGSTLLTALLSGATVGCDIDNSRTIRVPIGMEQADTMHVKKSFLNKLEESGIPREVALKYDRRTLEDGIFRNREEEIVSAYHAGITPEVAHAYNPKKFLLKEIWSLKNAGVSPGVVNEYLGYNFGKRNILRLVFNGVLPEIASKYDSRFRHDDPHEGWGSPGTSIPILVREGVKPEVANLYSHGFDGREVCMLYKAGVAPEVANSYTSFTNSPSNITQLAKAGISGEQVESYMVLNRKYSSIADISIRDVINFVKEDINPGTIEKRLKQLKIDKDITR